MKRLFVTTAIALTATAGVATAQSVDLSGITASGRTVTIPSVSVEEPGFVAVMNSSNGEMGQEVLGYTMVEPGDNAGVSVDLSQRLKPDTVYYVTLFSDTNGNGTFDPGTDEATMVDGARYMNDFRAVSASSMQSGQSMEQGSGSMESGSSMSSGDTMEGSGSMESGSMENGNSMEGGSSMQGDMNGSTDDGNM